MIHLIEKRMIGSSDTYWTIEIQPKGTNKRYELQPCFECLQDAMVVAETIKQLEDTVRVTPLLPESFATPLDAILIACNGGKVGEA